MFLMNLNVRERQKTSDLQTSLLQQSFLGGISMASVKYMLYSKSCHAISEYTCCNIGEQSNLCK